MATPPTRRAAVPLPALTQTLTALALTALAAGDLRAASGPEWGEPCDADPLPAGATPVTGPVGVNVEVIEGSLGDCEADGGGDYQDMFVIRIDAPALFSAILDPTRSDFDTQLWLFEFTEVGLLGNDDDPAQAPFSGFGPTANDGSGATVSVPGLYYLAISGFDSDPVSGPGAIFLQATRTEVSGPDGPGGSAPISGWAPGVGAQGDYAINLTGVVFIDCPADFDANGFVDFLDLLTLLAKWGPCPRCAEDLDGNGFVEFADLLMLLASWGRCV